MILDTSALIAILFAESDAEKYAKALVKADYRAISAATFVEAAIVAESQAGSNGGRQLDALIRRAGIVIEPVTAEQAFIARQAFLDYGKGRSKAALNYGDCFSYALAKATGEPLLFKGRDFTHTDIEPA